MTTILCIRKDDEVLIVDPDTPITREDYDNVSN